MTNEADEVMSPHKLEACKQLSPLGQRLFKYVEFDDDEEILAEVHKHPIGLIFIWLTGGFITATIVLVALLLTSGNLLTNLNLGNDSNGTFRALILLGALLFGGLAFVMTAITAFLYRSSTVFITSEKMAEVVYVSLFNRRVTQLGIGNVEDVTVVQRGVLPRIFHYGNLLVETAGETNAPDFTYVPGPNRISQIIIQAHEAYVEKFGN